MFLNKFKNALIGWPKIPYLGIYLEERKAPSPKSLEANICSGSVHLVIYKCWKLKTNEMSIN